MQHAQALNKGLSRKAEGSWPCWRRWLWPPESSTPSATPAPSARPAAKRQLPIYSVERTDGKFCSISFDAAWGNEDTQILIDILARYDIKATFFVVGDWAEKYPESVKALHDAGHEVMSHSNHHDHYNTLTAEQIIADVTASNERISASTGVTPTLIRCPYGEYDDHVISAIRSMGMEPIQWDVDSLDWKDYDAPTICKRVTSKLGAGVDRPVPQRRAPHARGAA